MSSNRVAEKVRLEVSQVNSLTSNMIKVFLKAPLRMQLYYEMLFKILLLLEPILTRLEIWLRSFLFTIMKIAKIL